MISEEKVTVFINCRDVICGCPWPSLDDIVDEGPLVLFVVLQKNFAVSHFSLHGRVELVAD